MQAHLSVHYFTLVAKKPKPDTGIGAPSTIILVHTRPRTKHVSVPRADIPDSGTFLALMHALMPALNQLLHALIQRSQIHISSSSPSQDRVHHHSCGLFSTSHPKRRVSTILELHDSELNMQGIAGSVQRSTNPICIKRRNPSHSDSLMPIRSQMQSPSEETRLPHSETRLLQFRDAGLCKVRPTIQTTTSFRYSTRPVRLIDAGFGVKSCNSTSPAH
jgi:hypothetical protein